MQMMTQRKSNLVFIFILNGRCIRFYSEISLNIYKIIVLLLWPQESIKCSDILWGMYSKEFT